MKSILNKLLMLGITLFLVACSAKPQFVNGKYYMGGDSNCKRYKVVNSSTIECFTSSGASTGYRYAMTDQQLQMYMHKQKIEQQNQQNQQVNRPVYCNKIGTMTICN